MKLPCAVTRDLLPLYAENMVEPDTKTLIEQHLSECPDCRKRLSETETAAESPVETVKPLLNLRREIRKRRRNAAIIAALFVFIGVYTFFFHAGSMRYVPWQDGLISVAGIRAMNSAEEDGNDGLSPESSGTVPMPAVSPDSDACTGEELILNVSSFINGFQEHMFKEEDGTTTVILQAFSTNPVPDHLSQSRYEYSFYPVPDRLIYGFEQPQELLWGTPRNSEAEVLPRLALACYLIIAVILAGLSGLAWIIFRKRKHSPMIRRLFFAPVSYILAHLLLKGIRTDSFFMERDFISILLTAAALYALLSMAWQVLLQRKREQ